MKIMISAAVLSLLLLGCTDTKTQETALLNQVIAVHDKVMAEESHLMKNKMQLDTLLKSAVVPEKKQATNETIKLLEQTDAKMEDWMHQFDAENKGKSHDEIMAYLNGQKKQIDAIAKEFASALAASDTYLKTNKQ